MTNELLLIDNLIGEHAAIAGHMKTVCGLLEGWDDVVDPESEPPEVLNQKHLNLKNTMAYLVEGLKEHHAHEQEVMPVLIGTPLFDAIEKEHGEMLKQLEEINFILVNVDKQGFALNGAYLKLTIDNLCRLIGVHITNEEVILQLLKKRFI